MTKRKHMCSQEGRSALMSRIRRSDTKPEVVVRIMNPGKILPA